MILNNVHLKVSIFLIVILPILVMSLQSSSVGHQRAVAISAPRSIDASATSDEPLWTRTISSATFLDAWGNGGYVYACGYTMSGGNPCGVIARYDISGTLLWNRAYSHVGKFNAIWGDESGVYTAGYSVVSSEMDVLVVKWNVTGGVVWFQRIVDGGNDYAIDVWGDGSHVYACGTSQIVFGTQSTVYKWDVNGNPVWAINWQDGVNDRATGITGSSENIFVVSWINVSSDRHSSIRGFTKNGVQSWYYSDPISETTEEPRICSNGEYVFAINPFFVFTNWCGALIMALRHDGTLVKRGYILESFTPVGIACDSRSIIMTGVKQGELVIAKYGVETLLVTCFRLWHPPSNLEINGLWVDASGCYPAGRLYWTGSAFLARWRRSATPVPSIITDPMLPVHNSPVAIGASGFFGDEPVSYSWDLGYYGGLSSSASPVARFPQPGIYTITLRMTDADGDVGVVSQNVSVGTDILPTISCTPASQSIDLGEPASVVLHVTSGNGLDRVFVNFGDGQVDTLYHEPDTLTHVYDADGSFTWEIQVIDHDGDVASITIEITVTDWDKIIGPIITTTAIALIFTLILWGYVANQRGYWIRPPRPVARPPPPPPYEPHVLVGNNRVDVVNGRLDLSGQKLDRLSLVQGLARAASYVRDVDVSENALESLDGFAIFANARSINARSNHICFIKKADLPGALVRLDVSHNSIEQISSPASNNLKELDISANRLTDLTGFGEMNCLSRIKLDGNPFPDMFIESLGGIDEGGWMNNPGLVIEYGRDRGMRQEVRAAVASNVVWDGGVVDEKPASAGESTALMKEQAEVPTGSVNLGTVTTGSTPPSAQAAKKVLSLSELLAFFMHRYKLGALRISREEILDRYEERDTRLGELLNFLSQTRLVRMFKKGLEIDATFGYRSFWARLAELKQEHGWDDNALRDILQVLADVAPAEKLVALDKMYQEEPRRMDLEP